MYVIRHKDRYLTDKYYKTGEGRWYSNDLNDALTISHAELRDKNSIINNVLSDLKSRGKRVEDVDIYDPETEERPHGWWSLWACC